MKKPIRIGFDIDGVVVDIYPVLFNLCVSLGKITPDFDPANFINPPTSIFDLSKEEANRIFVPDFFANLPPKMEVIEDIQRWTMMDVDIHFITARYDVNKDATVAWLRQYGILDCETKCIHSRSKKKVEVVEKLGIMCYVDDYPAIIESMEGVVPYRFVLEYNSNAWYKGSLKKPWHEISAIIDGVLQTA